MYLIDECSRLRQVRHTTLLNHELDVRHEVCILASQSVSSSSRHSSYLKVLLDCSLTLWVQLPHVLAIVGPSHRGHVEHTSLNNLLPCRIGEAVGFPLLHLLIEGQRGRTLHQVLLSELLLLEVGSFPFGSHYLLLGQERIVASLNRSHSGLLGIRHRCLGSSQHPVIQKLTLG